MRCKYLYHLTSVDNLSRILKEKLLTYGRGKQRGGYNEKQISFTDYLSRYLDDFGDVCFEFKARNLFEKNKIYPFDYGIENHNFYLPDGFPVMPFWECEWQARRVKFEYEDIKKVILFSDRLCKEDMKKVFNILRQSNIRYKIMQFLKLSEPNYDFFIERYLERIQTNLKIKCKSKSIVRDGV